MQVPLELFSTYIHLRIPGGFIAFYRGQGLRNPLVNFNSVMYILPSYGHGSHESQAVLRFCVNFGILRAKFRKLIHRRILCHFFGLIQTCDLVRSDAGINMWVLRALYVIYFLGTVLSGKIDSRHPPSHSGKRTCPPGCPNRGTGRVYLLDCKYPPVSSDSDILTLCICLKKEEDDPWCAPLSVIYRNPCTVLCYCTVL
jgi:hypothetical protein